MTSSKQKMAPVRRTGTGPQLIGVRNLRRWRSYLTAYLFLAPALALYLIFVLRPTFEVFILSLYDWNGIAAVRQWVGLGNFRKLFADAIFWQALRHNLAWTVVIVFFNVFVGLIAAALLSTNIRGRIIFRLAYFLPVVQASIVTAMIWRWIYNPDGILNVLLRAVGLGALARGWLGDFNFALPALAVAAGWAGFGLSVVIFLAGIQGIDQTLYDAARIDGASGRQTFFYITIPSLRNVITIVVILALIGAFQAFDIIWATTQGGPIRSTELLATYMFKKGIQQNQYGYGSAVAVVLTLIILTCSAVYMTIQERNND